MLIVILDDDIDRQNTFRQALSQDVTGVTCQFFNNAPDMIAWLQKNLHQAALLSLDHDLGPNQEHDGEVFDPGTGRDVANYLAQKKPTCPVIVHSSNGFCTPGMMLELEDFGWFVTRVVPYCGLEWINSSWCPVVNKIIGCNQTV